MEARFRDLCRWFEVACLPLHTEYVLVKSVGPKSCELSYERRDWRLTPFQFNAEIVEVEIGGVAIYHPFGEFHSDVVWLACPSQVNGKKVASALYRLDFYTTDDDTTYLHVHNLIMVWKRGKYSPEP
ncbi:hypothetical protein TNCV_2006611 [Trichonephila clavipes]|nr:hypothetical protein TNCV_2006611 [Trichonephila clavipes]